MALHFLLTILATFQPQVASYNLSVELGTQLRGHHGYGSLKVSHKQERRNDHQNHDYCNEVKVNLEGYRQ